MKLNNELIAKLLCTTRSTTRKGDLPLRWFEVLDNMDIPVYPEERLALDIEILAQIDENLTWLEENDGGFGREAKMYRRTYKQYERIVIKECKKQIKGHLEFLKEWSKPRTQYVNDNTGKVHNGLWYVIKTTLSYPKAYGFKWSKK